MAVIARQPAGLESSGGVETFGLLSWPQSLPGEREREERGRKAKLYFDGLKLVAWFLEKLLFSYKEVASGALSVRLSCPPFHFLSLLFLPSLIPRRLNAPRREKEKRERERERERERAR